ncbi:hypothetical protein H8356DRAFT_1325526 [Neocallimastix lanati (nom. inval.)]|nr:hypothetical protein H8356DRAFT_1325526 [Neocallimastix sp. JGI-2020a]
MIILYKRFIFGLSPNSHGAPATFQREMNRILFDSLVEEHITHIKQVLEID